MGIKARPAARYQPRGLFWLAALVCCLLWGPVSAWAGASGVVSGLQAGAVQVRLDAPSRLKAGDQVELSYRAGMLDMSLGRFKVEAVMGRALTLQAISVTIPPRREMKVMVHRLQPLRIPPGPRGKK